MEMTFLDYINNPMGKDNAVMSNREMYRAHYMNKFNALMVRERGKFDYTLYKNKDNYIIHIKVPSETVKNFYYDIVIYFYPKDKSVLSQKSLERYHVKFYSNDPAFVFTFAYAFEKNKLFFDDLIPKMSKSALKDKAKEKNPKNEVGYVKTLYLAYLFMKNQGLFNKIRYVGAKNYNKKELLASIMDADEKISLRQEGASEQSKKNNKKSTTTTTQRNIEHSSPLVAITKKTNKVSNVSTIKRSKTVKRK